MVLEALRTLARGHLASLVTPAPAASVPTRGDVGESIPRRARDKRAPPHCPGVLAPVVPGNAAGPSPAAAATTGGPSTTNPVGGPRRPAEPARTKIARAASPWRRG